MPTEESVRNTVIQWLTRNDYELRDISATRGRPATSSRRGRPREVKAPDLIAKRRGQNFYYYIEVKGSPHTTGKFYQAIGEILIQMARTTPANYAIAFPVSYAETIKDLLRLRAWQQIRFRILIVRGRGEVVELKPTANGMRQLQALH